MRLRILPIVLLAFGVADAAEVETRECRDIRDERERLACYDRKTPDAAATRERDAKPSAPVIEEVVIPRRSTRRARIEGTTASVQEAEDEAAAARPEVVSVREAPSGHQLMTLSNGEVWSENEVDFRRIKASQLVTIKKKRLNTVMELEDGRIVHVHRVK